MGAADLLARLKQRAVDLNCIIDGPRFMGEPVPSPELIAYLVRERESVRAKIVELELKEKSNERELAAALRPLGEYRSAGGGPGEGAG